MQDWDVLQIEAPEFRDAKVGTSNTPHGVYQDYGRGVARGHLAYCQSSGELKKVLGCPQAWHESKPTKSDPTTAMKLGDAVDIIKLTPTHIKERIAVCPEKYTNEKGEEKDWNWNAKVCKQFKVDHAGALVLKANEWEKANQMAVNLTKALDRWGLTGEWADGASQVMLTGVYVAKVEGKEIRVPLRALVDKVPSPEGKLADRLIDLKTTGCGNPFAWQSQVFDLGMHMQAALYLDLWNAATGDERTTFMHVIVENESEDGKYYQCARRILSQRFQMLGRNHYVRALSVYARCLATGIWPDYEGLYPEQCAGGCIITDAKKWMAE